MEAAVEIMGAWEVQDLRVACHAEPLLDSRSLMEKRNATSGKVPSYLLTTCVFARQFWCAILRQLDLSRLTPNRRSSFAEWWKKAGRKVQKHIRKGFNSFCILGAWTIWKHRNASVFDGVAPNLQLAVQAFKDEAQAW